MQFDSLGVLTVWKEIKSQEEVWFMNSSADSDQRKQTVDVEKRLEVQGVWQLSEYVIPV